MKRAASTAIRLVSLAVAMSGFRMDRLPTVVAGCAALAFALFIQRHEVGRAAVLYFSATWVFYYLGNTIVLAQRGRRSPHPERAERDFAIYESFLAFAFVNQTLSLSCLAVLPGRISDYMIPTFLFVAGAILFATGFLVKLWAAYLVGLGVYYYRDLFLGTRTAKFVTSGPYRVFRNPMYGIGNLHSYGYALLVDSVPVLLGAACLQAGVYGFFFVVERSFVLRMYKASS